MLSAAYGQNDGSLRDGETVSLAVVFSEAVYVSGGAPSLSLSSGGTASYINGSGTSTLVFSYTVASGHNAADLAINSLDLNGAVIRDIDGNDAVASGAAVNPPDVLSVDTIAPAGPSLALASGSDTGISNIDRLTNDNTPTLTGNAEAGAVVQVLDGSMLIGQTTADGAGNWSFTADALDDGTHNFFTRAIDTAGNTGASSLVVPVTIDTRAPPAPSFQMDPDSDTGTSNSDNITYVTTPNFFGTAEPLATVRLFDGQTLVGATTADAGGNWSVVSSPLGLGVHSLAAIATDAAGNSGAASASLNVVIESPPLTYYSIDKRVAAGADDAEERRSTGAGYIDSSDLELTNDSDYWGVQTAGIRFRDLGIPANAVITNAYIQFTSKETGFNATDLTIKAQLTNALAFTAGNFNISGRPVTAGTVSWSPQAWSAVGLSGLDQRTSDLSALIQEVVSQSSWSVNNALAFIIGGDGKRTAASYEFGANAAPLLHVEYYVGSANSPPVAVADAASTNEDTALTINVLANDTDPESDTLVLAGLGAPAHGTVLINSSGTVSYTPFANYSGSDSFSYTISDGHGGVATASVSVTVNPVNDTPVALNDVIATAVDTDVIVRVLANDRDTDGDNLSVASTTSPQNGSVAIQPDGTVLYTPNAGFIGADVFSYTTSDGHGGSATATATVHVGEGFGSVRFAVIGDFGVNNGYELAVANLVNSFSPDFIVTAGDNTYGSQNSIDTTVGQYYSSYIGNYQGIYGTGSATNRFFPSIGNHDWTDAGVNAYLNYFTMPASTSGNERYYDFYMGPIQFFVVDSDGNEPDGITANSVQANWLHTQLANSVAPWQVVIMHEAPYSSGEHGSTPVVQWPFEQWGVDAVIAGHDHDYERIMKDANLDGKRIPFFVNGAGGAGLYPFGPAIDPDSIVRYNADHGAMLVTATDTQLTLEFWSTANGGTLIDSYSILV